jgi:O-methyltransferase
MRRIDAVPASALSEPDDVERKPPLSVVFSRTWFRRKMRSLVRRGFVPIVATTDSYTVQHLPEWIGATSFDFLALRRLFTGADSKYNSVDLVRLCLLVENVRQLEREGIEGSVAELGVYKGTTAKVLHTLLPQRRLYLFDTFEGFDAHDLTFERGKSAAAAAFRDVSYEAVRALLGASPLIMFCKGHFPATTAAVPAGEQFALVHLDADLFKPTLDALEYFYPRMAPGGFMIMHDYSSLAWPGVADAVDSFFNNKPESPVLIPDRAGTAIVRKLAIGSI